MKKIHLPLVALALLSGHAIAGNWFGSGPWANGTYYAGNLDGKYQAAVTGANTAGILGFAIRDGSPPFLQSESQELAPLSSGGSNNAVISNQQINFDNSLNYYAIFVNGRTYTGATAAGVNYDNSSVFGALIGTQPTTINTDELTTQQVTNVTITNSTSTIISNGTPTTITVSFANTNVETVTITNQVPVLIATGVDGSFQASITGNRGVFTFQGPGQMTSPGPIIDGQQTTATTAFTVNGLRTSFASTSSFQQLGQTQPAAPTP